MECIGKDRLEEYSYDKKNTEFSSHILRSDMRLTGERPGQVKQALRTGERGRYYVSNTSESLLGE